MGKRELFPEVKFFKPKMNEIYIIFSLLIVFSTFMAINSFNPIHAIFWLVLIFFFSSGLLILLNLEFLPLIIIIIYVGAIAILFLFVIMMLDIIQLTKIQSISNIIPIITIIISLIIIKFWFFENSNLIIYNKIDNLEFNFNYKNQIINIANLLYSDFWIPFIYISILLLIAMIGAIILSLEINKFSKNQLLFWQHQRNNSWI